jgi:hypothetical protein
LAAILLPVRDSPLPQDRAQGFTAVQLGPLVYAGLAKLRGAGRPKVFRVKITEAGQRAIAE